MRFFYFPFVTHLMRRNLNKLSPYEYLCVHLTDIIVESGGLAYNLERLDYFIYNFDNKISDKIRVISMTIEGDPVITNIEYDGHTINVADDTSYDQWGSNGISYFTGTNIIKEENESVVRYKLYDDNNNYIHKLISYRKCKPL